MGADASRTQLFVGVSSMASATGGIGGVFRLIPFNEGSQNPAIISGTPMTTLSVSLSFVYAGARTSVVQSSARRRANDSRSCTATNLQPGQIVFSAANATANANATTSA
jgi:hypothetical protein